VIGSVTSEACRILGCSQTTLQKLIRDDRIKQREATNNAIRSIDPAVCRPV
jgi:hypothetical protein